MKALFMTYLYLEEANGITKKIIAQVDALKQHGLDIHFCHFIKKDGIRYWGINGKAVDRIGTRKNVITRQLSGRYYDSIISHIKQENIGCVYLRYSHNGSPTFNRFLKKVHKLGVKILMEIPTYPYDGEHSKKSIIKQIPFCIEKHSRKKFHRYIGHIITFSDDKEIFDIPTINISNAIDAEMIPLNHQRKVRDYFIMTGVANLNFWHGYDRIITGLAEYYKTARKTSVYFNIVGNGIITEDLKELCKQKGVERFVRFLGPREGLELDRIMADTDLCIGCLACHRKNITEVKALKNVEYATRGIPFIYSEKNNDFDNQPYVIKAPQNDTPIDIADVIEQFNKISATPQEIRDSVSHLTWNVQMGVVANVIRDQPSTTSSRLPG